MTFNQNDRVHITNLTSDPDNNLGLSGVTGRVELVPPTHLKGDEGEVYYFVPDDPSVVPGIIRAIFGDSNVPVKAEEIELIKDSDTEEEAA